jgi:hypothetical protein
VLVPDATPEGFLHFVSDNACEANPRVSDFAMMGDISQKGDPDEVSKSGDSTGSMAIRANVNALGVSPR